jgi:Uma2 family endonuclease
MNQMSRISAASVPSFSARFTAAEFLRMCEIGAFEDWKVELVDGELERRPPPGNEHSRRQMVVVARLLGVVPEALLRAEAGVDLGNNTVLGCDAAILHRPVEGAGNRMLRPDEVMATIEISESTRERDIGLKRRKYAAAGIAHYWVVDSEEGAVHVHSAPVADDYAEVVTVRFGQPLPVPGTNATITLD